MQDVIQQAVRLALSEDVGTGDVSAALVTADTMGQARIVSREPAVLCGTAWVNEVFLQVDPAVSLQWAFADGQPVRAGDVLCTLSGPSRALLTGERTALNFLQLLSATATQTARYVQRIAHTRCKLLDTRKTLPGLRVAQKYAVTCGGGVNHRMGLYDQVLIKENHIMAAGSIQAAVQQARQQSPGLKVEVETENLDELQLALNAKADIVMLDNFDLDTMRQAVHMAAHTTPLEASGGVTLETIQAIAETGVDFVSVGDITKNVLALDLSMRFAS